MKDIITKRDGRKYEFEWFDEKSFSRLKNVKQVYGFIFDDDGKLLIVNPKSSWRLPGGGLESNDKTFEDTLIRETEEEADAEISDITPLGYIKVTPLRGSIEKIHYLLRYVAKLRKLNPQTSDFAINDINERKLINPKEFSTYIDWGDLGEYILQKAIVSCSSQKPL